MAIVGGAGETSRAGEVVKRSTWASEEFKIEIDVYAPTQP